MKARQSAWNIVYLQQRLIDGHTLNKGVTTTSYGTFTYFSREAITLKLTNHFAPQGSSRMATAGSPCFDKVAFVLLDRNPQEVEFLI